MTKCTKKTINVKYTTRIYRNDGLFAYLITWPECDLAFCELTSEFHQWPNKEHEILLRLQFLQQPFVKQNTEHQNKYVYTHKNYVILCITLGGQLKL